MPSNPICPFTIAGRRLSLMAALVTMNIMPAPILGLFNFGGWEIILILAVVLILFGAKRLPELAKGLGTGIKEFKKATREVTEEVTNAMDDAPPPQNRLPSSTPVSTPQTTVVEAPQTVPQSPPVTKA